MCGLRIRRWFLFFEHTMPESDEGGSGMANPVLVVMVELEGGATGGPKLTSTITL